MAAGSTTTVQDLDGYWEACVAPQISELESRFERCDDLRANNWVIEASDEPAAPKKRRMKKATRKAGAGKAGKAGARPSTRAFLAQMRQKKRETKGAAPASPQIEVAAAAAPKRTAMETEDDESQRSCKRFGLAGMTVAQGAQLLTPVRASKRDQETLGSAVYMTPVRRSARKVRHGRTERCSAAALVHAAVSFPLFHRALPAHQPSPGFPFFPFSSHQTPSKYKQGVSSASMADLLQAVDFSFKPNDALGVRGPQAAEAAPSGPQQQQRDGFSSMLHASPTTPGLTRRLASAAGTPKRRNAAAEINPLNAYLFDEEASGHATPTPPCSPAAATANGGVKTGKLISLTPMSSTPMHRSGLSRVTSAPVPPPALSLSPAAATGGVVRFAQVTPGRQMRELLGTDVVITPVRRSSRLVGRGGLEVDSIHELPEAMDFGYMPNENLMD